MAQHPPPSQRLDAAKAQRVIANIEAAVLAGQVDRATADGMIATIHDRTKERPVGQVTANRIEQLAPEDRDRIQDTSVRLQKFQRDLMKRKRAALLAIPENEWQALVDAANEDEENDSSN